MTLASLRDLLLVVMVGLSTAACQTEDTAPKPHYVSNASNSASAPYYIEFRSRYALSYGHTYVAFGRVGSKPEVAGLHPKSNSEVPYVLGHFVPVPAETGWSDGDLEEAYRSASWRVKLSESQYRAIVADIRKLQARSTMWHAALYNCNAFVAEIARSMGYKAPAIQLRPQQFVTRLREMNEGTPVRTGSASSTSSTNSRAG